MNLAKLSLAAPALGLGLGLALLAPGSTSGYSLLGTSLDVSQRDFRVFNNFSDVEANDNQTPHAMFPGQQGAVMAIWKASVEWGSELHGDGSGDPHQPIGLGSGGANFDVTLQGQAPAVGSAGDNIHSEISGSSGGVFAFAEAGTSGGWRIRYYSAWTWDDGPGIPLTGIDLQSVACHEYGHVLGLGHSSVAGATMSATFAGGGVDPRSIEADDQQGIQAIYGRKAATKPLVVGYTLSGQTLTVLGSGFDTTQNSLWFTPKSAGGDGTPVQVTGVPSSGSTLTVTLPANAGAGDLLVRKSGAAPSSLSNAWPFDPQQSGQFCGLVQYGLGLGGANLGTLDSPSAPTLGTPFQLSSTGFQGSSSGLTLLSLGQADTAFLGGTLLVDMQVTLAMLPFTTSAGAGTLSLTLPSNPGLAFLAVYAQSGVLDAAQPSGWALSNGLRITLCP